MFKILDIVPTWVYALAIAVLTVLSGYLYVQGARTEVQLAEQKLAFSEFQREIGKAGNQQLTNLARAIDDSKKREAASRAAADTAATKSASLQSLLQEAERRLQSASADAVRDYAATAGKVFRACIEEYREMGRLAQGHADDSATLEAAWPKPKEGGPKPTQP